MGLIIAKHGEEILVDDSWAEELLGRFETKEEAAEVYNRATSARYGEFALLNKIERIES